jgi:hypothetical protein
MFLLDINKNYYALILFCVFICTTIQAGETFKSEILRKLKKISAETLQYELMNYLNITQQQTEDFFGLENNNTVLIPLQKNFNKTNTLQNQLLYNMPHLKQQFTKDIQNIIIPINDSGSINYILDSDCIKILDSLDVKEQIKNMQSLFSLLINSSFLKNIFRILHNKDCNISYIKDITQPTPYIIVLQELVTEEISWSSLPVSLLASFIIHLYLKEYVDKKSIDAKKSSDSTSINKEISKKNNSLFSTYSLKTQSAITVLSFLLYFYYNKSSVIPPATFVFLTLINVCYFKYSLITGLNPR